PRSWRTPRPGRPGRRLLSRRRARSLRNRGPRRLRPTRSLLWPLGVHSLRGTLRALPGGTRSPRTRPCSLTRLAKLFFEHDARDDQCHHQVVRKIPVREIEERPPYEVGDVAHLHHPAQIDGPLPVRSIPPARDDPARIAPAQEPQQQEDAHAD